MFHCEVLISFAKNASSQIKHPFIYRWREEEKKKNRVKSSFGLPGFYIGNVQLAYSGAEPGIGGTLFISTGPSFISASGPSFILDPIISSQVTFLPV